MRGAVWYVVGFWVCRSCSGSIGDGCGSGEDACCEGEEEGEGERGGTHRGCGIVTWGWSSRAGLVMEIWLAVYGLVRSDAVNVDVRDGMG